MRTLIDFAAITALLVVVAVPSPVAAGASIKPLQDFPLLQCSACEQMAREIGRRMNITATNNKGSSVLKSHRLEERKAQDRRVSYEGSELRAVEVLELLCQDVRKNAYFVQTQNKVRTFGSKFEADEGEPAQIYSTKEEGKLSNIKGRISDFCEAVLDDYEDVLVRVIRKKRFLHEVFEGMCVYGMKLCERSRMEEMVRQEQRRYAEYEERVRSGKPVPKRVTKFDDDGEAARRSPPKEVLDEVSEL